MKKLLVTGLMGIMSATTLADDFHLYVIDADNTKKSYAIDDIQKLSFDNGQFIISAKDGTSASYALSSIGEMYFDTPLADAIEATSTGQAAYPVWSDGNIRICGTYTQASIYNAGGQSVGQLSAGSSSAFDASGLPAGIYIVRIDSQSFKVVKP